MPRFFARFTVLLLALSCGSSLFAQVIVEKDPTKQNPTLSIVSVKGSDTIVQQLRNDLLYSDWFTVVTDKDAKYQLSVVAEGGESPSLHLQLKSGNDTLSNRKATAKGDAWVWMVHRAVDQLILDVFKNPGLCASRIAFTRTSGNGDKEIWLSDFDGSDAVQMTHNRSISVEPDWSPTNRYLLYTLYENTRTSIIMVDLEQRRNRRLSASPGLNSGAAFAPNGREVAMTLSRDGEVNMFVMDLITGKQRALTKGSGVEASPTWAPDSRRICYVTDEYSSRPTLYMVPAGGGRPVQLLQTSVEAVSPDWSPVSNRIVFSVREGSEYTLAMIDMSGSGKGEYNVLVRAAGNWEAPSWMADGRHVVCSRDYNGKKELYMVDSLYGTIRPLRNQTGNSTLPANSSLY